MEIPLKLLIPNPNFIHDLRTFSTLLALVIAAIAAFLTRSRRLIPKLLRVKSVIFHPPSNSYSSSDDDDSGSCSDADSDDDEAEEPTSEEERGGGEDSGGQNRNFEWGFGDSVVRLWEPYVHATAGTGGGRMEVGVWDSRSAAAGEAARATWRSEREVVGVAGREEKVYVSDDVGWVTVVDLRNVRSTLLSTLFPDAL